MPRCARLRTPVLAGRDTLLVDPAERRSLRAGHADSVLGGVGAAGATASPADDHARQALALGLSALSTAGDDARLRLVRLLYQLCDAFDGTGWVLSTLEDGASTTVAFAQSGESAHPETTVRLSEPWAERARLTGVLDRAGDTGGALAQTRGVALVAAAIVDDWLLELLAGDDAHLDGAPAVLRALASVAVHP